MSERMTDTDVGGFSVRTHGDWRLLIARLTPGRVGVRWAMDRMRYEIVWPDGKVEAATARYTFNADGIIDVYAIRPRTTHGDD